MRSLHSDAEGPLEVSGSQFKGQGRMDPMDLSAPQAWVIVTGSHLLIASFSTTARFQLALQGAFTRADSKLDKTHTPHHICTLMHSTVKVLKI